MPLLRFAHSPEFQRLLAGEGSIHVERVALEIARDAYPELEIEAYMGRIQELADRVRPRCPRGAKVRDILGQINWVLFVEEELRGNGDDYYNARNSYLNEVLDRRLGIPISLSVLYRAVAERLGLTMAGINLPVHFMLRVDDGEQTWFVDAFHEGAVLSRDACERKLSELIQQPVVLTEAMGSACSIAVIVTRMLRNLKTIYLNAEDLPSALPVQRRLTALNPHESEEVHDLGVLCLNTDRPGEAIDPLQTYLATSSESAKSEEIQALLEAARRQVARTN